MSLLNISNNQAKHTTSLGSTMKEISTQLKTQMVIKSKAIWKCKLRHSYQDLDGDSFGKCKCSMIRKQLV
jgi:hypothetical protein